MPRPFARRLRPIAACVGVALASLCGSMSARAAEVRYFAVWSYTTNAPREEIEEGSLEHRNLGYWELEFDAEGGVTAGTYRGKSGIRWLGLRYVEVDGKVYADLYGADGSFIKRKSTPLDSRAPRWANGAAP